MAKVFVLGDQTDEDWERFITRYLDDQNSRLAWDRYVQASNHQESKCSSQKLEELVNRIYQYMVNKFDWDPISEKFSERISEDDLSNLTSNRLENLLSRLLIMDTDSEKPYILTPECERVRRLDEYFSNLNDLKRRRRKHRGLHLVPRSGQLIP